MAEIARLWTTMPGENNADQSIKPNQVCDVVADCEGSGTELAAGLSFSLGVVAINRSTSPLQQKKLNPSANTPAYGKNTHGIGVPPVWEKQHQQFRWELPADFGASHDIIEILAYLQVGNPTFPPLETHVTSTFLIRE